jgi:hypothetical protein
MADVVASDGSAWEGRTMRFSQRSQDRIKQRVDADFDRDLLQDVRERKALVDQTWGFLSVNP